MVASRKEMAPAVWDHPGARPTETEITVDKEILAGDPIAYRAGLDRRDRRDRRLLRLKLEYLEERYRHELMDDAERAEIRDRVFRLRRRLAAVPQAGRPTTDTREA
jgi:hypothetical protein